MTVRKQLSGVGAREHQRQENQLSAGVVLGAEEPSVDDELSEELDEPSSAELTSDASPPPP